MYGVILLEVNALYNMKRRILFLSSLTSVSRPVCSLYFATIQTQFHRMCLLVFVECAFTF
jgi:hypothetical protein